MKFCLLLISLLFASTNTFLHAQTTQAEFEQQCLWLTRRNGLRFVQGDQKPQRLGFYGQKLSSFFADRPLAVQAHLADAQRDRRLYQNTQIAAISASTLGYVTAANGYIRGNKAVFQTGVGLFYLGSLVGGVASMVTKNKQYCSFERAVWHYNRSLLGDQAALLEKYDQRSIMLQPTMLGRWRFVQQGHTQRVGPLFGRIGEYLNPDEATQSAWRKARVHNIVGTSLSIAGLIAYTSGFSLYQRAYNDHGLLTDERRLKSGTTLMVGSIGCAAIGSRLQVLGWRHLFRAAHLHNSRVPFE